MRRGFLELPTPQATCGLVGRPVMLSTSTLTGIVTVETVEVRTRTATTRKRSPFDVVFELMARILHKYINLELHREHCLTDHDTTQVFQFLYKSVKTAGNTMTQTLVVHVHTRSEKNGLAFPMHHLRRHGTHGNAHAKAQTMRRRAQHKLGSQRIVANATSEIVTLRC